MDKQKPQYLNEKKNVILIEDETHPLYIVKGDKNFLIDTGITAKARKYYEDITGILQGGKIDTLLLTHSHYDHVGACSFLQDIYNFNIAASHETVELLKNPDIIEMIDFQNQELKESFADDSKIKCEMLKNLGGLENGEKIEISQERYFEVISSPGHSHCSISYLLHPDKILFPGDSAGMMETNGKKRPVFFASYKEYENTLLKLARIEPEVLAFSHALFIKGKEKVKEYFDTSLEEARNLKDWFLKRLMGSKNNMEIAEEFLHQEYIPDSVMGTRESYMMNLMSMVSTINREFITTNYQ